VVGRKHSAGGRAKPGPRHFCPKLTSALFAISMHKFPVLAPDVLTLPSRSHNRAFLRSDGSTMVWGFRGFLRATGAQKRSLPGAISRRAFLRCEFVDHARNISASALAGSRVPDRVLHPVSRTHQELTAVSILGDFAITRRFAIKA
jgi:hypothetical protein